MLEHVLTILLLVILLVIAVGMLITSISSAIETRRLKKARQRFSEELEKDFAEMIETLAKALEDDEDEDTEETNTTDYSKMNIQELKALAKQKGVKKYYHLHKDELIKELTK